MKCEFLFNSKANDFKAAISKQLFSSQQDASNYINSFLNVLFNDVISSSKDLIFVQEFIEPFRNRFLYNLKKNNQYVDSNYSSRREVFLAILSLIKTLFSFGKHSNDGGFIISQVEIDIIIKELRCYLSLVDKILDACFIQIKLIEGEKEREINNSSIEIKYKNVLKTYQYIFGISLNKEDSTYKVIRERIEMDLIQMGFDVIVYNGDNDDLFEVRNSQSGENKMFFPAITQNDTTVLKGLIYKK